MVTATKTGTTILIKMMAVSVCQVLMGHIYMVLKFSLQYMGKVRLALPCLESSTLIFFIKMSVLGTYFYPLCICKVPSDCFQHSSGSIIQLTINNSCSIYCSLIFCSLILVRSAVSHGVGNHHVWHQEAAAQLALEITSGTTVSGNPFWPGAYISAVTVSPQPLLRQSSRAWETCETSS